MTVLKNSTDDNNYKKKLISFFDRFDRKILIYLIFVAIAASMWFVNKLNNEFVTYVTYPVVFNNLPPTKIIVNDLPATLQLKVKGNGYTLLRYRLSPPPFPVFINLKDYWNRINKPQTKYFLLETNYETDKINKQMPGDIQVIGVLPDTISFMFSNIIEKKLPIIANVNLTFDKQCMLDGQISFSPAHVTVKGPATIIDTLKGVYTKLIELNNLDKTTQRYVNLVDYNKLKIEKQKILMTVPVAKYTEAIIDLPITTAHLPDSLQIVTFPRLIRVSYMISLQHYGKINSNDFLLEIDYNDIDNMPGQNIPVYLKLSPKNVHNIKLNPGKVEYLIEKRKW